MSGLLTVCKGGRRSPYGVALATHVLVARADAVRYLAASVRHAFLLITLFAALLAGCGGSDNEAESEAEGSGRGTVTCEGSAMSGESGLPSDFPELDEIIFVESEQNGPTRAVDGYAEDGLGGLYQEYREAFDEAGYEILFDEQEEDDAEISYRATDSTEGIVALRSCDEDKTSVHITNRPG